MDFPNVSLQVSQSFESFNVQAANNKLSLLVAVPSRWRQEDSPEQCHHEIHCPQTQPL